MIRPVGVPAREIRLAQEPLDLTADEVEHCLYKCIYACNMAKAAGNRQGCWRACCWICGRKRIILWSNRATRYERIDIMVRRVNALVASLYNSPPPDLRQCGKIRSTCMYMSVHVYTVACHMPPARLYEVSWWKCLKNSHLDVDICRYHQQHPMVLMRTERHWPLESRSGLRWHGRGVGF
jgi:hypothetical protein